MKPTNYLFNMYSRYFKYLLLFLIIFSCNKNDEISEYSDSKLFKLGLENWKSKRINKIAGEIKYTATEVPLQYYLLKNIGNNPKKIDSIYSVNKKERIIEVEFTHAKEDDLLKKDYTNKSYDDAVKYMAFTIGKDFTVVTSSNDTIKCSGVNFERNFKVAPFKRALLYFNNIKPTDNVKLIYQDHLFGNGLIKFNFNEIPLKL